MAKMYKDGKWVEADTEYVEYVKAVRTIADAFRETLEEIKNERT